VPTLERKGNCLKKSIFGVNFIKLFQENIFTANNTIPVVCHNMLSPNRSKPKKDYVVIGGQRVYLNFIHSGRHRQKADSPVPHSLSHPFVKESSLPPPPVATKRRERQKERSKTRRPSSTSLERKKKGKHKGDGSEGDGGGSDEQDGEVTAAPPPAVLELRNQIMEHELNLRGGGRCDAEDLSSYEFSIEEFTPPQSIQQQKQQAERRKQKKAKQRRERERGRGGGGQTRKRPRWSEGDYSESELVAERQKERVVAPTSPLRSSHLTKLQVRAPLIVT